MELSSRPAALLSRLEESGRPGAVRALGRALAQDHPDVADALLFEQNLEDGLYDDDPQLLEAYEQAGRTERASNSQNGSG